MSESGNSVFCTQCGGENNVNAKFCSSCGAKIEPSVQEESNTTFTEERNVYAEGLFSSNRSSVDAEVEAMDVAPESTAYSTEPSAYTEEIKINYSEPNTNNRYFDQSSTPYESQYYSSNQPVEKTTNGYIGVSIAALICGILSILCCCAFCVGIIFAIAAVILGIVTIVNKYDGKGMAIAGIVTAAVGLILAISVWVGLSAGAFDSYLYDVIDEIDMY